jgi:hypothetical protein
VATFNFLAPEMIFWFETEMSANVMLAIKSGKSDDDADDADDAADDDSLFLFCFLLFFQNCSVVPCVPDSTHTYTTRRRYREDWVRRSFCILPL